MSTTYESLKLEADCYGIAIFEISLPGRLKGAYTNNAICISSSIPTQTEKTCVLAEELGHHHTSIGNILNQKDIRNRKQEKRARTWGYLRMIHLSHFISAHSAGVRNRYEFAQFIGVTEDFLIQSLSRYQELYGLFTTFEGHMILFNPLMVIEPIES
ncbi:ImmA/IrrE family metallo-endopeptidase [Cohnella sp. GCM10020058]|uniref:ImmA/IrrE family metallo-endopeptidase n=1 Tax=Cohnella sp. GCM10020058 TaxID=3317330 RepID=UPI0036384B6D